MGLNGNICKGTCKGVSYKYRDMFNKNDSVNFDVGTIFANIEPIMATILGLLVYHEMLSIYEIIGIVLVLTAIVLLQ